MKNDLKIYNYILLITLVVVLMLLSMSLQAFAFHGNGTLDKPYLISSYADLCEFRNDVNSGNSFRGIYFKQTNDIVITENWDPIGTEKHPFMGVYDGSGYSIKNLRVNHKLNNVHDCRYSSFFAYMGGTIANIDLEDCFVTGENSSTLVGTSVGHKAAILNCISRGNIFGKKVGGIALNFSDNVVGNVIACTFFDGIIQGEDFNSFLGYGGNVKLYNNHINKYPISIHRDVLGINSKTSTTINKDFFKNEINLLKHNIAIGLSQVLYADRVGVTLLQKDYIDNRLVFSESNGVIESIRFVNDWGFFIIYIIYFFLSWKYLDSAKNKAGEYHKFYISQAVSFFILCIFFNTAIIAKGINFVSVGNLISILLFNISFVFCFVKSIDLNHVKNFKFYDFIYPIMGIILILCIEFFQYDFVPKFDGELYYGSFCRAIENFNIDFITFIGYFMCWKWIQGLSLLVSPIEFLYPGEVVGLNLANSIITIVTFLLLFYVFKMVLKEKESVFVTLLTFSAFALPYQLGMFSYFAMDQHLLYFVVWLCYASLKNNVFLVSFLGFMLFFTKITGGIFYLGFIMYNEYIQYKKSYKKNTDFSLILYIINNRYKLIILFIPLALYMFILLFQDMLIAQEMYYAYPDGIGLKGLRGYANTILHSFVYAFRWVIIGAIILLFISRKSVSLGFDKVYSKSGKDLYKAIICGCGLVLLILLIYKGNAELPRYTAIFNSFYVFTLPLLLCCTNRIIKYKKRLLSIYLFILIIQMFYTIDPSILFCDSINSGKKEIYKLCLPRDKRGSMALGIYDPGHRQVLSDLHAYNIEANFYDELLERFLNDVNVNENDNIFLYDIYKYEFNISGSSYPIYWDTVNKKRVFIDKEQTIYIKNVDTLTNEEIISGTCNLPDRFYLLVAARINTNGILQNLKNYYNFNMFYKKMYSNTYGSFTAYGFTR